MAKRATANGTEIGTIQNKLRRRSIRRLSVNKGHAKTKARKHMRLKTKYARSGEVKLVANCWIEETRNTEVNA